jgi:hypothetical protein
LIAAAVPADQRPSSLRRARETLEVHRTEVAVALYALIAIGAVVAAYYALFTQFGSGDDEGTLLVSLKAFVNGETLYRQVYSPYGPFYYELFGGFFALTGWSITNDASRLIVTLDWVVVSLLFGLAVQRLTGRLLLGVSGMLVAFSVLYALTNEPMHPQVLAVLIFACLTLLLASGPQRRLSLAGGCAGALLAGLVLTKVNIGGLAVGASALAAVLTIEPLHRRRWLRWPVVAATILLPLALMSRDLRDDWVRDLILLEALATLGLLIAATTVAPRRGAPDDGMLRWALAALAGFLTTFAAIVGCLLLTGSTLGDLYDGVISQPLRLGKIFFLAFNSPGAALDWGVASVAMAVIAVQLRGKGPGVAPLWPGLARIAVGATIWLTVARSAPFSLGPASNQLALPLVLAWVAVLPPAGAAEPSYRRFLRVALAALSITGAMQVYPVAGNQVGVAATWFVAVGAVCIADGLAEVRAWSEAKGREALLRFGIVSTLVIAAFAGKMALDAVLRPAVSNALLYRDQPALSFPAAHLLHPPAEQGAEYEELVGLLHAHHCSTFIGYPNVNSLYLWSGISPPKPNAPGAWVAVLDSEGQQWIVDQMRASPRPCALRKDPLADAWLQGTPPPDTPLVRYIFNDLRQVGTVDEWQFLVPKRPAGALNSG